MMMMMAIVGICIVNVSRMGIVATTPSTCTLSRISGSV